VTRTVDHDPDDSANVLDRLGAVGIDMEDVEQTLEDEGVNSFAKSFDELLQSLTDKAATF
jgi:transaldolase